MEQLELPIRNAALFAALRRFVSEALALLRADVDEGADVGFSVAEHKPAQNAPALYEYRPLVESFVRQRLSRVLALPVAEESAWAVASDPAASAYLRAGRADTVVSLEDVARDEVLVPVLLAVAERHPDFGFDESTLLTHYLRLEKALYADHRRYVAVTPVWGVRLEAGEVRLADGVRIRQVDEDLFRREWPEAAQMNWGGEHAGALPRLALEFERAVGPDDDSSVLDPVPAVSQVVASIRALTGGSVCAGPVVWERFDYTTLAPRPVAPLAALRCGALPSRVDTTVAKALPQALRRLSADPHGAVARALERYQAAAAAEPAAALRTIYDTIVEIYADEREPTAAALRLSAVTGGSLPERQQYLQAMQRAGALVRDAAPASDESTELARLLASGLRATIAAALVGDVPLTRLQHYADSVLLGERSRRRLGVRSMKPVLQTQS